VIVRSYGHLNCGAVVLLPSRASNDALSLFARFLVASPLVQDLLLFAKYLFVAAMVAVLPPAGAKG
jgi:hypothetical protein